MGTSKGYLPPTGYLWTKAKRSVTDMVNHNFESESIGKAVGNYARATSGGSRGGSGSRVSRMAEVGSRAGGFFDIAQTEGFKTALEEVGLGDLADKSSAEVYAGLLDYLTGNGSTLDDSVVRDSMSEVLKGEIEKHQKDKEINEIFEQMDMEKFFVNFITKFVQKDFLLLFAEKIQAKCGSIKKYKEAEKQIKGFIEKQISEGYVYEDLSSIDWSGDQGKKFIEKRCNEVFKVFNIYLGE
jgi:hypothetical protein